MSSRKQGHMAEAQLSVFQEISALAQLVKNVMTSPIVTATAASAPRIVTKGRTLLEMTMDACMEKCAEMGALLEKYDPPVDEKRQQQLFTQLQRNVQNLKGEQRQEIVDTLAHYKWRTELDGVLTDVWLRMMVERTGGKGVQPTRADARKQYEEAVAERLVTGRDDSIVATGLPEFIKILMKPNLINEAGVLLKKWMVTLDNISILFATEDYLATSTALNELSESARVEFNTMAEGLPSVMQLPAVQPQQPFNDIAQRVGLRISQENRIHQLHEMQKAILKELRGLGEGNEDPDDELERKIDESGMSKEARKQALQELGRLRQMRPESADATIARTYIEFLVSLPWGKKTVLNDDIGHIEKTLEEDHYGLEEIKKTVVEFMAAQKHSGNDKGPILCFVGPPGVGKTSLGKSIARATGREYVRMALGGVRDEAEIRGHRRTYIGALPGKILQHMKKAGTGNPLFLLDELDKMTQDVRGDPASALLEVLDPEQNATFTDHYLDVEYNMSKVMFVCTANYLGNIPAALRDRMKIIELPSYTQQEKLEIAKRHLIGKQMKECGLTDANITFDDSAIRKIILAYTHEAGVRELERTIGDMCRKVAKALETGHSEKHEISDRNIADYLGPGLVKEKGIPDEDKVGYVNGLAVTSIGGVTLPIEARLKNGKNFELEITGNLQTVMKESVQAARTAVEALVSEERLSRLEKGQWRVLGADDLSSARMHIHALSASMPKDGPSAGLAEATAMISALTKVPVNRFVAMTGEISLYGDALVIGGLAGKLEAAQRDGCKTVLIPRGNVPDLAKVKQEVLSQLTVIPVDTLEDVLVHALTQQVLDRPAPVPVSVSVPDAGEVSSVVPFQAAANGVAGHTEQPDIVPENGTLTPKP